jgi:DNA-binding MarR family transcriptional regulator
VIGRLETKGWIRREPDQADRRRKILWLTSAGHDATVQMKQAVERVQANLLAPLEKQEAEILTALLAKVVAGHETDKLSAETSKE